MVILKQSDINRQNSPTWIACNDDSRSGYWRSVFTSQYGGEFTKNFRYWSWKETESYIAPKFWVFAFQGKEVKTFNLYEFCKEKSLTRSAMYDLMHGRRPQHKGYTFLREEANPKYVPKNTTA